MFDGQPSCDDVINAKFVMLVADASSPTYARCEGCEDEKDVKSWDIEELEINASGWDHITLYSKSPPVHQLAYAVPIKRWERGKSQIEADISYVMNRVRWLPDHAC